jgi:hypothetical protein
MSCRESDISAAHFWYIIRELGHHIHVYPYMCVCMCLPTFPLRPSVFNNLLISVQMHKNAIPLEIML